MERCQPSCPPRTTVFCPVCGKADRGALSKVKLMGFVGVAHTTSESVQNFLNTGDPEHLNRRK